MKNEIIRATFRRFEQRWYFLGVDVIDYADTLVVRGLADTKPHSGLGRDTTRGVCTLDQYAFKQVSIVRMILAWLGHDIILACAAWIFA